MSRTMLNLTTAQLVERIESGDAVAAAEGMIRLAHGVRHFNERKLRAALADVLVDIPAPDSREPELPRQAEPSPAPQSVSQAQPASERSRPTRSSPANEFGKRVHRLAADNERVRKSIRARKLASREGWTHEDIAELTDADCLSLVAQPIR